MDPASLAAVLQSITLPDFRKSSWCSIMLAPLARWHTSVRRSGLYWRYSLFELPLLVSGIFVLALAGIIWQRRSATGAAVFALMLLALALWSLRNMLEIGCTRPRPSCSGPTCSTWAS